MESLKVLRSTQIIILGVCIALATIVSTVILSKGLLQIKKFSNEVIDVTGSAQKQITSDYVVWNASFSGRSAQLKNAYEGLQADLETVITYFKQKGLKEDEIVISQITTEIIYQKNDKGNPTNDIEDYLLTQNVEVRSYDVKKVDNLARQSTELINQNIALISQAPQYFYTKLAELKIEMLSMATENAKARAITMAKAAGNKIGVMRSAKMGVFQITPANSYDVSWYGENDTSSFEKKVQAVVTASFAIQ
ncbi:MAG: SIMPL domain-containing protein [Candidatus Omnitrophota bacterium]